MIDETSLPAPSNGKDDGGSSGDGGRHLYVDTLNYRANDLTELRKLAETNPDIAKQVLDLQDWKDRRKERSYRLGLVFTSLIAISILACGTYLLVNVGVWTTVAFVSVLLGISHVVRSILKGEFSETSWFGKIISGKKGSAVPEDET